MVRTCGRRGGPIRPRLTAPGPATSSGVSRTADEIRDARRWHAREQAPQSAASARRADRRGERTALLGPGGVAPGRGRACSTSRPSCAGCTSPESAARPMMTAPSYPAGRGTPSSCLRGTGTRRPWRSVLPSWPPRPLTTSAERCWRISHPPRRPGGSLPRHAPPARSVAAGTHARGGRGPHAATVRNPALAIEESGVFDERAALR